MSSFFLLYFFCFFTLCSFVLTRFHFQELHWCCLLHDLRHCHPRLHRSGNRGWVWHFAHTGSRSDASTDAWTRTRTAVVVRSGDGAEAWIAHFVFKSTRLNNCWNKWILCPFCVTVQYNWHVFTTGHLVNVLLSKCGGVWGGGGVRWGSAVQGASLQRAAGVSSLKLCLEMFFFFVPVAFKCDSFPSGSFSLAGHEGRVVG